MTYLTFLLVFIIPPILLVNALLWWAGRHRDTLLTHIRPVLGMALVALVYTTPWDNYLVAHRIWWYRPAWVLGVNLGWVPVEEYAFFVLQTLLTGGWTLLVLRWSRDQAQPPAAGGLGIRRMSTLTALAAWAAGLLALLAGPPRFTYAGLILIWALPPLALQAAFGADLLWLRARALLLSLAVPTTYLILADAVAIRTGTWIINPRLSLSTRVAGFPLEEALFFMVTNTLVVVGLTLWTTDEGRTRAEAWLDRLGLRARLASLRPTKTLPSSTHQASHERA